MSDLGKLWDYLRYDPKWEIGPARNYGGIIFFGSKDIGGAAVIANLVRDCGFGDVPVMFSGSNGEAAKFRLAAEKMKLDPRQIIEGLPCGSRHRIIDTGDVTWIAANADP